MQAGFIGCETINLETKYVDFPPFETKKILSSKKNVKVKKTFNIQNVWPTYFSAVVILLK